MKNKKRIVILDTIRGILIILVILYHFLYDLNFIFNVNIPLMNTAGINIFRDIFVSMLIFISGICCNLSKSNLKRGIKVLFFGLVISVVTITIIPEERIIFGILHFYFSSFIKIHKKLDVPLAHLRSLGSLCSRFATAHTFATLRYAFGALHSAHAFTTKQSPKSIKIKFCNPH